MKIDILPKSAEEFCGTSYAAMLLDLSVGTVQALVEKNELRAWKTGGGHRRISMQSILDYQKRHHLKVSSRRANEAALKLLVVEDDALTRELIKSMVEQWNLPIDCTAMASAIDALIDMSSLHPDVLITDLNMPGVDGFELLRTLRANPSFADISVLALTGLSETQVAERGGLPENTVLLGKPLDMSWLHGYFVALLGNRKRKLISS
jgi:excisionase family DNA binding protein